jgi:formate dehydrogenase major subunit
VIFATDPWREVSWGEAINYAASEFKCIQAKYGRDSVGGITSSRCTNEETSRGLPLADWLRPQFYVRNFGRNAGLRFGGATDVIMVIGANPTHAHPVFASHMNRRLREGARLIVVDPRRTLASSTWTKSASNWKRANSTPSSIPGK